MDSHSPRRRCGAHLRRSGAVGLLGAALILSGCFTLQYEEGSRIPESRVESIRPGVTTRGEVLSWFGAPETFTDTSLLNKMLDDFGMSPGEVLELPFADAMVFRFSKGRMQGVVLGVWNRMAVRVTTDTLVVFFDGDDRVSSYGYRRGTDEFDEGDAGDAQAASATPGESAPRVQGGALSDGLRVRPLGEVGTDAIANP